MNKTAQEAKLLLATWDEMIPMSIAYAVITSNLRQVTHKCIAEIERLEAENAQQMHALDTLKVFLMILKTEKPKYFAQYFPSPDFDFIEVLTK